ncbi:MAG: accessory factor UbiK family protein [Planctomycetes bacterium]|nr:accessory factor UbiK family protein [Planctomycetota bacterium]
MADSPNIEDLVRKLTDAIPTGIKELEAEAKKQFRSILETGISKMDMVTREEFDIQTKVLAKTRKKVDDLEQRLSNLEKPETS